MLWAELEDNPKPGIPALGDIYRRNADADGFAATVAEAAVSGVDGLSRSGSWLLKHWVENGNRPTPEVVELIVENLDDVKQWEAILQFCQMLAAAPEIMVKHAADFAVFLRRCVDHKTPFIRAWAITAFVGLAGVAPEFEKEASLMLERGRADPAGSVQARMRHIAGPDSTD